MKSGSLGVAFHDGKIFCSVLDGVAEKNFVVENLSELKGKSAVIGLPSCEVIIQSVNIPVMSHEDMCGALALSFEEIFSFPESEAVFNVSVVETPLGPEVLGVAAKRASVKKILDVCRLSGVVVEAIEPEICAMVSGVQGVGAGLCVVASSECVAVSWQGKGIFFKATDRDNILQDITNTIQYITTRHGTR